MELIFFKHAWEDYLYWQRVDRKTANRINQLIKAIIRKPYAGIENQRPFGTGFSDTGTDASPKSIAPSTRQTTTTATSPNSGTTTNAS